MPWIVKLIIDCGFGSGDNKISICGSLASDTSGSINHFFLLAAVFAVLFAITGALRFFFITRLGQRVIADIRKAVFDRLTLLSPAYFEHVRTGEVLSRLTTDTTFPVLEISSHGSVYCPRHDLTAHFDG